MKCIRSSVCITNILGILLLFFFQQVLFCFRLWKACHWECLRSFGKMRWSNFPRSARLPVRQRFPGPQSFRIFCGPGRLIRLHNIETVDCYWQCWKPGYCGTVYSLYCSSSYQSETFFFSHLLWYEKLFLKTKNPYWCVLNKVKYQPISEFVISNLSWVKKIACGKSILENFRSISIPNSH